MMRPGRITAVLMLAFVLSAGISAAAGETEAYTDVAVLSTTDMHGRCWETDVLTGAASVNNMLRVSTAVRGVRGAYGEDCVLLIDNGDLFQGTAVSEYQILRAWDGTEPPAMALCLKEIGYTAFVPGNHEFNYPWDVMSAAYRWLEENGVPVVAANICRDGAAEGNGDGENGNGENGDGENGNGENVFAPYIVKTVTVNGQSLTLSAFIDYPSVGEAPYALMIGTSTPAGTSRTVIRGSGFHIPGTTLSPWQRRRRYICRG